MKQTPWQTVGPFFHYALPWPGGADLVAGQGDLGARLDLIPDGHNFLGPAKAGPHVAQGEAIELFGAITDGEGAPVADALVEIWQANAFGRYNAEADARDDVRLDPGFIGFGRAGASADGVYRFRTIRPGRVPGPGNSLQAPHIAVGVMGRGLIRRLVTRIYFEDDPANPDDPILALVPAARRGTLMARREGPAWRFDIRLQGAAETVFFDLR